MNTTIGEIAIKISSGQTPKAKSDVYIGRNGVPFIRSKDINIYNIIDYNNILYLSPIYAEKRLQNSQVMYNDILLGILATSIGKVSVYTEAHPAQINQALALIRIDQSIALSEYIKLYMLSDAGQLEMKKISRNTNLRPNVRLSDINNINIFLPSMEIQQEIVSKFQYLLVQYKNINTKITSFNVSKLLL